MMAARIAPVTLAAGLIGLSGCTGFTDAMKVPQAAHTAILQPSCLLFCFARASAIDSDTAEILPAGGSVTTTRTGRKTP